MADHPEMRGPAESAGNGKARRTAEDQTILDWLKSPAMKRRIASLIPKHISPERMLMTFSQAVRRSSPDRDGTPQLLKVPQDRMLGAFLTCARLGLEPNSVPAQVHLIPFDVKRFDKQTKQWVVDWTDVSVIIDYQGYVELAYRSGKIEYIQTGVVHEHDEWSFERGTNHHLRHRPMKLIVDGDSDRGDKIAAYAYAKIIGAGGMPFEWMWWPEILAIRDKSQGFMQALRKKEEAEEKKWSVPQAWLKSPWVAFEDAMARKTPWRALQKWLPKTAEMQIAQAVDDRSMSFDKVWNAPDRDIMEFDAEAFARDDETMIDEDGVVIETGNGGQQQGQIEDRREQTMQPVKTEEREKEPTQQETRTARPPPRSGGPGRAIFGRRGA
jgi:recombination protein RecT